jgi:hypothetical protein
MVFQMRKFNKRLFLLIPLILILALVGFVLWASTPSGALMAEAQAALQTDETVGVDSSRWIVFTPTESEPTTGLIFYPGGRVQADAYAPIGRALAEDGYLVVIVPMPLNLAIFGINRANEVMEAYSEIEHWAIAGHSLGGAMAANYVKANPQAVDGLILLASYPQASDTLAEFEDLVVASFYGTRDGLLSVEQVENSRQYLPPDSQLIPIEGGNHAQFGWYGEQAGDNPATISREEQQEIVVEAMREVLRAIAQTL